MRFTATLFALVLAVAGCGEPTTPLSPTAGASTSTVGVAAVLVPCQVRGDGTLAPLDIYPGGDRFRGSAKHVGDRAVGHWTHRTPDGRRLKGKIESLDCAQNGRLLITIQGVGKFDGVTNAPFEVTVHDAREGEPADYYRVIIVDPAGNLLYTAEGFLASGDVEATLF